MLGLAAGASAIGSGVGAYKRNQGNKAQNAYYDYARDVARSEQYNSIFDSPAGKSLLKLQNASDRKALDAINNRAVAGGATMENQLAARQSINENRDRITSQLLQYDDRNRRAWKEKDLALAGQQAQFNANTYYQAAQDWSQWGGQMASSLMSLGSTGLLGGAGSVADAAPVARADMPSLPEIQNPISLPGAVQMQDQSWGSRGATQGLGGLKGAHYENGILVRD